MKAQQRLLLEGPAGALDVAVNEPAGAPLGLALVAHPHPLFGGSLDNKVVQTLAKAFVGLGYVAVRMNFRGVGSSEGTHDEGLGETQDWLVVHQTMRSRYGAIPIALAGFSFGAFVQSRVARLVAEAGTAPQRIVLVAPAVGRYEVEPVPAGTLVVHGDEDDVVPLAQVLAWARPQRLPVAVFSGTGHYFHGYLTDLQHLVQHSCACRPAD